MPALIDSLRRDHANMELLLQILEQEIAVFDRPDRPDFDIIQGVLDYFRSYPAQCHHPKEDLLFAKLRARDPEGAAGIIDIEADHGQSTRRLELFARLVDEVLDDQPIARGVLDTAVHEFVEHERRHMELEERELLPNALASLHAEDWADLDWPTPGTRCSAARPRQSASSSSSASRVGNARTKPIGRGTVRGGEGALRTWDTGPPSNAGLHQLIRRSLSSTAPLISCRFQSAMITASLGSSSRWRRTR